MLYTKSKEYTIADRNIPLKIPFIKIKEIQPRINWKQLNWLGYRNMGFRVFICLSVEHILLKVYILAINNDYFINSKVI